MSDYCIYDDRLFRIIPHEGTNENYLLLSDGVVDLFRHKNQLEFLTNEVAQILLNNERY